MIPTRELGTFERQLGWATLVGLAVGIVCDPRADWNERWCATIGLDASGVGSTPESALRAALEDLERTIASLRD